ncbi:MAG: glycosyltransferase family 2 protein [Cyanophyceae cyanobacterium]
MPQISVIIPAYNAEATIAETIESVQQQTVSDFEIVVIDDGSRDRTPEVLASIAEPRLRLFQEENGGVATARNRGFARATGEFIAFLDADDLWTPNKLEQQLAALQRRSEAGVAYSWTYYIDHQSQALYPGMQPLYEGNIYAELLLANILANGSNPLIRRVAIERVGGFDPALSAAADWDFYLRLAAQFPFVVVPEYQVLYRQSAGSMSAKVEAMKAEILFVLERAFQTASPEQSLRNRSLSAIHQYCAELYLNHSTGQERRIAENLQSAIRLYPQSLLQWNTQRTVLKFLLQRLPAPVAHSFWEWRNSTRRQLGFNDQAPKD